MAAERNTRPYRYTYRLRNGAQYVVDGNTVREVQPVRRPQPERAPRRKPVPGAYRIHRNRIRTGAVSRGFLLLLMAACAMVLCSAVLFLHTESQISGHRTKIRRLENQLTELRQNNEAKQDVISGLRDLGRIYEIATEEYGMVYASQDQIITYTPAESEYIYQHEDIPG